MALSGWCFRRVGSLQGLSDSFGNRVTSHGHTKQDAALGEGTECKLASRTWSNIEPNLVASPKHT